MAKSPSIQEVKAMLQQGAAQQPPQQQATATPFLNPVTIPMEGSTAEFVQMKESGVDRLLPEPDIQPDPMTSQEAPSARQTAQWLLTDPDDADRTVTVTDEEKDAYIKATLFDEPVVGTLPVLGDQAWVKVATLPNDMLPVIDELMLTYDPTENPKSSKSRWLSMYQRICILTRVRSMGKGTKILVNIPNAFVTDAEMDHTQRVEALKHLIEVFFAQLSPARYEVIWAAVRTADLKYALCNRKAASGNFWLPVGTV